MEMKKLHMGTMSYGFDSMDEVAHQLASAFGADQGTYPHLHRFYSGRLTAMEMKLMEGVVR
jgi:hypothetical protein